MTINSVWTKLKITNGLYFTPTCNWFKIEETPRHFLLERIYIPLIRKTSYYFWEESVLTVWCSCLSPASFSHTHKKNTLKSKDAPCTQNLLKNRWVHFEVGFKLQVSSVIIFTAKQRKGCVASASCSVFPQIQI